MASTDGSVTITAAERFDRIEKRINAVLAISGVLALMHVHELVPYVETAATYAAAVARFLGPVVAVGRAL